MPRLPRIYIKDAINYITCRAELNENIFKDEGDYKMFLSLLKKYKEQYTIKIYAYALLPNHLHLLVESQQISDFMHSLNNSYTKYFNSRYERKGHVLRERFKAALIERNSHLLKMTAYIHLNPQRVNLTVNAKDYAYSSYQAYLSPDKKNGSSAINEEISEVLQMLGNNDYAGFVSGMTQEEGELLHKKIHRGGIIGSEEFKNIVKSQIQAHQTQEEPSNRVEADTRGYKVLVVTGGFIILLIMGISGAAFYFINKNQAGFPKKPTVTYRMQKPQDLSGTEWQVRLTSTGGAKELTDNLIFKNGKFISARLYSLGYPDSNYSSEIDGGRLSWETMQSIPGASVSWRGEISEDKMTGIMSLREEGKPAQDFSFMSVNYRRRQ